MAAKTDAQEEFDNIISKASESSISHHPDDPADYKHDREHGDREEEDEYQQARIDENMGMPTFDRGGGGTLLLPHRDFDSGRTTGVKGVIADARSYEEARRSGSWRNKISRASTSSRADQRATLMKDDGEGSASEDDEFLERWRAQRREELQRGGSDIMNRRTSPSVRRYGRFDEVDALGYLDAIEKVGRDTVVVVFVYDHEVRLNSCNPLSNIFILTSSSAPFPKSSLTHSHPSSLLTRPSTSSESITKTSNSTTPASQPSSHTKTKEISSLT
jgi:hypothetical protein